MQLYHLVTACYQAQDTGKIGCIRHNPQQFWEMPYFHNRDGPLRVFMAPKAAQHPYLFTKRRTCWGLSAGGKNEGFFRPFLRF